MKLQSIFASLICLAESASSAPCPPVSLQQKQFKLVSQYTIKGLSDGKAVKGDDGYIWTGNVNGIVRRLDPSKANAIVSEDSAGRGIRGAIKKFGRVVGQAKVVVGSSVGATCYNADGSKIEPNPLSVGASLAQAPLGYGTGLLFLAKNGLPYKLDEECKSLVKVSNGAIPGAPTSRATLMTNPQPVMVYGTAMTADFITQDNKYSVAFATIGGSIKVQELSPKDGKMIDSIVVHETSPEGTVHEKLLILTDKGYLLPANHQGLNRGVPKPIACMPKTPMSDLGNGTFAVFCTNPPEKKTTSLIFNSSGEEISRTEVRDYQKAVVNAEPTSEATIFMDGNRPTAIMGFSDSTVKVIDLQTGIALDSFATVSKVTSAPSPIGGSEFYISEESGPLPEELTKSYIVSLSKPPIAQKQDFPAPATCYQNKSDEEPMQHNKRQPAPNF